MAGLMLLKDIGENMYVVVAVLLQKLYKNLNGFWLGYIGENIHPNMKSLSPAYCVLHKLKVSNNIPHPNNDEMVKINWFHQQNLGSMIEL